VAAENASAALGSATTTLTARTEATNLDATANRTNFVVLVDDASPEAISAMVTATARMEATSLDAPLLAFQHPTTLLATLHVIGPSSDVPAENASEAPTDVTTTVTARTGATSLDAAIALRINFVVPVDNASPEAISAMVIETAQMEATSLDAQLLAFQHPTTLLAILHVIGPSSDVPAENASEASTNVTTTVTARTGATSLDAAIALHINFVVIVDNASTATINVMVTVTAPTEATSLDATKMFFAKRRIEWSLI